MYSDEFKEQVARKMVGPDAKSVAEVHRETGVSIGSLYRSPSVRVVVRMISEVSLTKDRGRDRANRWHGTAMSSKNR